MQRLRRNRQRGRSGAKEEFPGGNNLQVPLEELAGSYEQGNHRGMAATLARTLWLESGKRRQFAPQAMRKRSEQAQANLSRSLQLLQEWACS